MKSLLDFLHELTKADWFGNSLNPVILSAAKDPQGAGRDRELASFLAGKPHSKKFGKSEVKSRVRGFFAALRMTGILEFS
jgi:hypothetical protein